MTDSRQHDSQYTGSSKPQPKITDKAHAVALAMLRTGKGYSIAHRPINGVMLPRVIIAASARKAGAA